MDASFLRDKFATGLTYARYVVTGTDEQQRRWQQVYELARLTGAQQRLIEGFARDMKILVVSGIWCGDCVQQCPLVARIAEANPKRIDLRFVDRDLNRDLAEKLRINGGDRVPVAVMMAEDFEFCAGFGDRSLARYRAMALRQLGAACPTGIVGPDRDELSATLGDWLNEIERVQLMLRLSPRLRQRHGD
jgi:thiol-disulfide isomerase/thioredoxin